MDPQAPEPQAPIEPAPPTPAPSQPTPPDYWKNPNRRWWRYGLVAGVIIIAAAAAYWFLLRSTPAAKPAQTQTSSQVKSPAISSTTPTKTYSSSNFNLSFSYPQDWTITDSGSGQMTVRSPASQLKSAAGQDVSGQVIMTIANKGQNLGVFAKGNATAVVDSQKVAYTTPTSAQRANTYLSFLQYASTTTAGALDGIYITGDNGYQKGQDIPGSDIAGIDPLVSVTFVQCASSACPAGTTTALSIASTSWSDTSFSSPITKMLESLAFN